MVGQIVTALGGAPHLNARPELQLRSVNRDPEVLASALRRVVHDYVSGWGIVLTQSPRERRRKKRIWNRRAAERHAFRRPVWMHYAHWSGEKGDPQRPILLDPHEELHLVQDISQTGIGLLCDRVPKSRLVVLSFDAWKGASTDILVSLRWRRRDSSQSYRAGGHFLGILMPE